HVQYICYRFTFKPHFQRFSIVSFASACFARNHYIGQKVHLNCFVTVTTTGLTSSTLYIERETTRCVSTYFGFGHSCKQISNLCEDTRISGRVGARCSTNRRLVNTDNFINVVYSVNRFVGKWLFVRFVKMLAEDWLEGCIQQC